MDLLKTSTYTPLPTDITTEEHHKNQTKKELSQKVGGISEALIHVRTVFPFTLFPDAVIIDRTKFTVSHRWFFLVADLVSIRIEDILNASVHVGPFFGSLEIHTRFFDSAKPYRVNWLWRNDALKLKRILDGAIIAAKNKIDTASLSAKELASTLNRLGQGLPDEAL